MKIGIAISAGVLLGIVPFVCNVTGYGSYWRYVWPVFVLVAAPIGVVFLVYWTRSYRKHVLAGRAYAIGACIFFLLTTLGALAGDPVRRLYIRRICHACEPILQALNAYHDKNGQFPLDLLDVPNMQDVIGTSGVTIRQGNLTRDGGLRLNGVDAADATIYLETNKWYCIVPIQKMNIVSITRFTIYARSNGDDDWRHDYIVWFIGG